MMAGLARLDVRLEKSCHDKNMVDSLHSMIAAHQDNFIESLDFGVLGPPSASYIVERRSTRIPFLAPVYGPDSVSTMRCVLADAGWVDPKKHLFGGFRP